MSFPDLERQRRGLDLSGDNSSTSFLFFVLLNAKFVNSVETTRATY